MDKIEPGLVEQLGREAAQARWEQKNKERALVEAMFREAAERQRRDEERSRALVESIHQAALAQRPDLPSSATRPKGIHHIELPAAKPGDTLGNEWNTYRREVGRLLSEGQAGRFVLVKGEEIIGLYDTRDAACEVGLQRFLKQPFLVHEIRVEEPFHRIRGINLPWTRLRFR